MKPGLKKIAYAVVLAWIISAAGPIFATEASAEPAPNTTRDCYNAGTRKLKDGKLPEAEAFLEMALASQNERFQPPALYNLGQIRFAQGAAELKKNSGAGASCHRGQSADREATDAIEAADTALAGNDVPTLVAAYVQGRGARKELKAASDAVRRALETYGATLAKWERASGDFKSAYELNSKDADARHNAEVVDRSIARLVDSLRELRKCAGCLSQTGQALKEKLKELKGRIPGSDMPPGGGGDDEDADEMQMGKQEGQTEGPSKEGTEIELTPEQAGWLLKGFKLDSDRRLPMTDGPQGVPKDRSRAPW